MHSGWKFIPSEMSKLQVRLLRKCLTTFEVNRLTLPPRFFLVSVRKEIPLQKLLRQPV